MQSIKVRQRIGADGILHLEIPVGMTEREVEVVVTYQAIDSDAQIPLSQFYGCIQDETFIRHPQGEQPEREPLT